VSILGFRENIRQVYLYDYRVFICGVDVSNYVQSIDFTDANRSGQGTADIVLTNPFDQWVITSTNISGKWRAGQDRYSEAPKRNIWQAKKLLSKKLVISRKNGGDPETTFVDSSMDRSSLEMSGTSRSEVEGDFLQRYSFGPGSCIFTRFDTVKIFQKHPMDSWESNSWFERYTGTVENQPFSTNYTSGESTISIHAFDVRATMAGMRLSANPFQNASYNTEQAKKNVAFFSDSAWFFKDWYPTPDQLKANAGVTADNIFAGKSFVDAISMIVTGKIGWATTTDPQKVEVGPGVGQFKPGSVYTYLPPDFTGPPRSGGTLRNLETWDNLTILGANDQGKPRNKFLTLREVNKIGSQSFWTKQYSPLSGFLHWLLPDGGLSISSMIRTSYDGMNNIMDSPDWTTRFELMSKICSSVDYEFSVTGSGDIVMEFPMYDFSPKHFGKNSALYQVNNHIKSDNISDMSGDICTGIESSSASSELAKNLLQEDIAKARTAVAIVPTADQPPNRSVCVSPILASRFGARIQPITFSGISSQAALDKITVIEFQKRLCMSSKMSIEMDYRPFLRPNRPMEHVTRNRIGRIISVTTRLPSGKDASISITTDAVRTPLLKRNSSGKLITTYQTVFGGETLSLSYNSILEQTEGKLDPNQGIVRMDPTSRNAPVKTN
jgi:hypothetical protein